MSDRTAASRTDGAAEVTIAIVDDNAVVRMGLRALAAMSERLVVVGEASDGEQGVDVVRRTRPDVTLLDYRMPKRNGVEVLTEVRPWTKVLMMTYTDDPDVIRAAVAAGASGYVVHEAMNAQEFERAVLAVADGTFLLSGQAAQVMRSSWDGTREGPGAPARPDAGMSSREVEVMDLIARGRSNGEIAADLFLSEKTVKNHINRIFAKLAVRSRAEAVARWLGPQS